MTADVLLHINTVQKIDLSKFEANLWKGKINEEQSKTYFLSIYNITYCYFLACEMKIGYNHG